MTAIQIRVGHHSFPVAPGFTSGGEKEEVVLLWLPVVCLLCIHPSATCSLPLSSWDPCLTKENRGSQGHSPGGRKREEGRAVLTVRQAVSPEAIQAEILQHSGQLTATVDLGLAGGEQAAEQRRQGQ